MMWNSDVTFDELRALGGRGIGLEIPELSVLTLGGKDGIDLLHRLSTNDVRAVGRGQCAITSLTTEKGRIIDLLHVVPGPDDATVIVSTGKAQAVKEWFEKFTITEDALLRFAGPGKVLMAVAGADALSSLAEVFGTAITPGRSLGRDGLQLGVEEWGKLTIGFVVTTVTRKEALVAALQRAGVRMAGTGAWDAARVLCGMPAYPDEISAAHTPFDIGLEHTVSQSKGCYVGQEVLARLVTYPKSRKHFVAFTAQGPGMVRGMEVGATGGAGGTITTVVRARLENSWFGLAAVTGEMSVDGSHFTWAGGEGTIHQLPLRAGILEGLVAAHHSA